jgi:predicted nucleic acid-binding protein
MQVYLDTMVFIYGFNQDSPFFEDSELIFKGISNGHTLCSSLFVKGELLVHPTRQNDSFSIARINRLFSSEAVRLLPFDEPAVSMFALLRGMSGVKPLDALHLASASSAGVDLFVTNDEHLLALTVLGVGRIASLREAAKLL